jgi:hypothetical protein
MFTGNTFAEFPTFDDLSSGDAYYVFDSFNSDLIAVNFLPFKRGDGSWSSKGVATVSTALMAPTQLRVT